MSRASTKPPSAAHSSHATVHEKYAGERSDRYLLAALNVQMSRLPPDVQQLLKSLEARVALHRQYLLKKQSRNATFGFVLAWLIPITSAVTTTAISLRLPNKQSVEYGLAGLGLVLTILTILNSVFRPAERATNSAHLLVQLHDWEMDLDAGLRRRPASSNDPDQDIVAFLMRKDRELSKIGIEVADQFSPKTTPEPVHQGGTQQNGDKGAGQRDAALMADGNPQATGGSEHPHSAAGVPEKLSR